MLPPLDLPIPDSEDLLVALKKRGIDPRDYFWCDFSDIIPHLKWDKTDRAN